MSEDPEAYAAWIAEEFSSVAPDERADFVQEHFVEGSPFFSSQGVVDEAAITEVFAAYEMDVSEPPNCTATDEFWSESQNGFYDIDVGLECEYAPADEDDEIGRALIDIRPGTEEEGTKVYDFSFAWGEVGH